MRVARWGLAAVLAALALAGCGGSNGDGGGAVTADSDAPASTVAATTTVEIVPDADTGDGDGDEFDPRRIYERDAPGVVTIRSVLDPRARPGVGSGFVLNGRGEIATNAHVVTEGEGRAIRKAQEVYVAFADGNQVPARIVGYDPNADVALLKIDPAGLRLRPLKLGTARDLRVGSPVAAIGSPFNEPQSLSIGVVSAIDRSIQSLTGFQVVGAIQTDAAINQGNSGGPLVNAAGEVLGINSQIRTSSGGGEGVGYAVPIDTVRRSLDALRADGEVEYAYLGVSTSRVYPQLARRFKLPVTYGAWVQEVIAGGPAGEAGLRGGDDEVRFQAQGFLVGGDVITAVDGEKLVDESALSVALLDKRPGEEVTLRVHRDGKARDVRVKLGARPLQTGDVRP